jgi:ABC-type branched-subunit amino acid transport system permease subunit
MCRLRYSLLALTIVLTAIFFHNILAQAQTTVTVTNTTTVTVTVERVVDREINLPLQQIFNYFVLSLVAFIVITSLWRWISSRW